MTKFTKNSFMRRYIDSNWLDECGVCEKCIPVCPKDLIEKKGYTMIIKDGCDDCGICLDMCPLGAIYEE